MMSGKMGDVAPMTEMLKWASAGVTGLGLFVATWAAAADQSGPAYRYWARSNSNIEQKLRRYLHSLVGGRDGKGWEFGRPVLKAELIHLAEEIPGVEGVDGMEIRDELRNVGVEHLRLEDDELPFLVHVHVAEKVRDDIK